MPHDGGFANKLVAKIEDLVTVFFLPLYFTLSGLSTDLTQLNDGALWGWTVCVLIVSSLKDSVVLPFLRL
jgi:Kef-type K+ transport system membrane component KefB